MHLVQFLLPLHGNGGQPFAAEQYAPISRTLTEHFGGLTASTRAPAAGLWQDGGQTVRDDVVVYGVMVETLDRAWWAYDREGLRRAFGQDAWVVRTQAVEVL